MRWGRAWMIDFGWAVRGPAWNDSPAVGRNGDSRWQKLLTGERGGHRLFKMKGCALCFYSAQAVRGETPRLAVARSVRAVRLVAEPPDGHQGWQYPQALGEVT